MEEDGGSGRSRVPPAVRIPRARQAPASGRAVVLWPWLLRHRRRRRQAESAERAGPGEASPGAGPQPGADSSCALCPVIPGHPESGAGSVSCAGVGLGGPGGLLSSSSVPLTEVGMGADLCPLLSRAVLVLTRARRGCVARARMAFGVSSSLTPPPETLKSSEKSGRRLPSRIGVAAARGRLLGSGICREMIFLESADELKPKQFLS